MARGRMQLQRIPNATSRQVTFSKRGKGLLKKACELSVLCDAEVAIILISQSGKISEFASHGMSTTLRKYQKMSGTTENCEEATKNIEINHSEVRRLQERLNILESNLKHTIGEDLDPLSLNELEHLERRMEAAAKRIRSRKKQMLSEHIGRLKRKLARGDSRRKAPEALTNRTYGVNCPGTTNADVPQQCPSSEESLPQTTLYLGFGPNVIQSPWMDVGSSSFQI